MFDLRKLTERVSLVCAWCKFRAMRYFCHSCHAEVEGRDSTTDSDDGEPICVICGSNFVERVGQGVEAFLAQPSAQGQSQSMPQPPQQTVVPPPLTQTGSSSGASTSNFQTPPSPAVMMLQLAGGQGSMPINIQGGAGAGAASGGPSADLITMLLQGMMPDLSAGGGGGGGLDDILHQLFMNEQGAAATPTTPEALASLRRERGEGLMQLGECGITLEPFEAGDVALVMPCDHAFKEDAIVQWLQTHDTCPGSA